MIAIARINATDFEAIKRELKEDWSIEVDSTEIVNIPKWVHLLSNEADMYKVLNYLHSKQVKYHSYIKDFKPRED